LDALEDTKLPFFTWLFFEPAYLDQLKDFHAPVINYSQKTSGIFIGDVRKVDSQVIAGGVDEIDFCKLTTEEVRKQWTLAREQDGNTSSPRLFCS